MPAPAPARWPLRPPTLRRWPPARPRWQQPPLHPPPASKPVSGFAKSRLRAAFCWALDLGGRFIPQARESASADRDPAEALSRVGNHDLLAVLAPRFGQ